ncbi:hypothetical protein Pst134EB_021916 [Puccinia striiformis f. sp. tritici]|nr:hypothetical protein Pst134EB_021916 [Puccinia striiformis f. sp. tritici]
MSVITLHTLEEFHSAIENGFDEETPIIINFCAERCAPYTGISLLFEQLATKYKGANLEFYRVNLDDDNTLASEAGVEISDLPTFILYRNCIQVETFKGSLPDRLKAMVIVAQLGIL